MAEENQTNIEFDPTAAQYEPQTPEDALDNLYEPVSSQELGAFDKKPDPNVISQISLYESEDLGASFEERFHANKVENPVNLLGKMENVVAENRRVDLAKGLNQLLDESAETGTIDGIDNYVNSKQEEDKQFSEAMANEMLNPYLPLLSTQFPTLNTQELKSKASQMYILNSIQEMFPEGGGFLDYAGAILVPDATWDWNQILGGDYFSTPDDVETFIRNFQASSPEERIVIWEGVKEAIREGADENPVQMILMAETLFDPDVDWSKFGLRVDQFDMATAMAGGVFAAVSRGVRARKLIKSAKNMGGAYAAAKAARSVMKTEDVAEASKVSKLDAANTLDSYKYEKDWFPDAADDVEYEAMQEIEAMEDAVSGARQDVDVEAIGLNDAEKTARAQQAMRKHLKDNEHVKEVRIKDIGDKGFTLSAKKSMKGVETWEDVEMPFVVDDITGGFTHAKSSGLRTFTSWLSSPMFYFNKEKDLYNKFAKITFQQEKARAAMGKAFESVASGLNTKESVRLNQLLELGDRQGKFYTRDELLTGGVEGVRYTPKEADAYFKSRRLFDLAYEMKNDEVRNTMKAQGMRRLAMADGDEYVRAYDEVENAQGVISNLDKTDMTGIWVQDRGTMAAMDADSIKKMYDAGYKLVKNPNGIALKKDVFATHMFVRADDVTDLPTQVVKYRTGYVPRFRKEGNYWVKKSTPVTVIGSTSKRRLKSTAEAYSSLKKDAEKFAEAQNLEWFNEKYGAQGPEVMAKTPKKDLPFQVMHDREIEANDLNGDYFNANYGMFKGARSSKDLVNLTEGGEELVPALEAMGKYLNNIATNMPLHEYRLGIQRRWVETAKKAGVLPPNWTGSFHMALKQAEADPHWGKLSTQQGSFLTRSHKQIEYHLRIPTQGEKQIQSTTRKLAEALETMPLMEKKWGKRAVRALHRFDHAHPVDAIKSATFDTLVGVLSPIQYVIQASGATIAMSISPQNAPAALSRALKFQTLDNIQDVGAKASWMKKLDIDPAEYRAWEKSGLYESVVSSNADFEAAARGLPRTTQLFANLRDKGRLFYKAGELFNRRFSYSTALEEFRKKAGKWPTTTKEMDEVFQRADRFMLAMSRANKAQWQKGVPGIPTQFMQVHSKYIEAIFGSEFTTAEKLRLGAMQAGVFGAAGVPFGEWLFENSAASVGVEPGDLNTEQQQLVKNGFVWGSMQAYLGIESEGVSRTSISKGIEELITKALGGELTVADALAGASGGVWDRLWGGVTPVFRTLNSVDFNPAELDLETYGRMTDKLLDTMSGWNNISKGYELFTNEAFRDPKTGQWMLSSDLNFQTKVAQTLGLQPTQAAAMYEEVVNKQKYNEVIKTKVRAIEELLALRFGKDWGQQMDQNTQMAIENTVRSFLKDNMHEQAIREQLLRRQTTTKTKTHETIRSAWRRMADGFTTERDILTEKHALFGATE